MMHAVLPFVQAEHFGMATSHLILLFRHLSHAGILIDENLGIIAYSTKGSIHVDSFTARECFVHRHARAAEDFQQIHIKRPEICRSQYHKGVS